MHVHVDGGQRVQVQACGHGGLRALAGQSAGRAGQPARRRRSRAPILATPQPVFAPPAPAGGRAGQPAQRQPPLAPAPQLRVQGGAQQRPVLPVSSRGLTKRARSLRRPWVSTIPYMLRRSRSSVTSNSRIPGQARWRGSTMTPRSGPCRSSSRAGSRPASPIRPGRSRSVKDMDRLSLSCPDVSALTRGKRVARPGPGPPVPACSLLARWPRAARTRLVACPAIPRPRAGGSCSGPSGWAGMH